MQTLRFKFADTISMTEVAQTLQLSLIAAESLHGVTRVQLSNCCQFSEETRTCCIDESTSVGEALSLIFAGYLMREFGSANVRIERIAAKETTT